MTVNCQYLNPIIEYSNEGAFSDSVVLSESHLVYSAEKNSIESLWSMNLETKVKQKLFTGSVRSLSVHNNLIYFTAEYESNRYHLWSSDGTTANTKKISNTMIVPNGQIYTNQGQLFIQNEQLQLHQIQNNQLINFEVKPLNPNSLCQLNNNDWVILSESQEPNTYILNRKVGTENNAFYQFSSEEMTLPRFVNSGSYCYFSYRDQGVLLTRRISEYDDVTTVPHPSDLSNISFYFSHKNRMYAVAGEDYVYNSIYRLTADLSSYDKSATLNDNFVFDAANSRNNLIAARVREDFFEGRSAKVFLDAELNFIPTYYNTTGQPAIDKAHVVQSDVVNGFSSYQHGAVIQTINSSNEVSLVNTQDYYFRNIISNPDSAEFFLILTDKRSVKTEIFSFTESPVLNSLINGIWHEHDIYSQGLVVQKGRRNNGSEYVFTTFYTFDEGEPLWLAGNAEFLPQQDQLNITLHKYDGIQLFEYDNTPNREVFGQLKINIETCNRIFASFSSEPYNISLNLYRIDDKSYDYLCNQFRHLPFDSIKSEILMEHNHD